MADDTPMLSAVILNAVAVADAGNVQSKHTEYVIQVSQIQVTPEGAHYETVLCTIQRRYSQFAKLHQQL